VGAQESTRKGILNRPSGCMTPVFVAIMGRKIAHLDRA
jgi:hypothetical protein